MNQCSNKILMVQPSNFQFNVETAKNNYYQKNDNSSYQSIQEKALNEFLILSNKLKEAGVEVIIAEDSPTPMTPDSIFPNNWYISEPNGKLFLCPMFAENRRLERKKFLGTLINNISSENLEILNLISEENNNKFLEGTGALVLDRVNKIAYGSLSMRCNKELFEIFSKKHNYKMVAFHSFQTVENKRLPIYHTNVMMAICNDFAILCKDSIDDHCEQKNLIDTIKNSGKKIIFISEEQTNNFAGNVIQVLGKNNQLYTLMSDTAYKAFTKEQIAIMEKNSIIIHSDISTIEKYGGGSVRCMIAEIF